MKPSLQPIQRGSSVEYNELALDPPLNTCSSGCLYKQGQLPFFLSLLDNQLEIHCSTTTRQLI